MHLSPCTGAAFLALAGLSSGCYASLGPTVGVDLPTGRATLGIEASGATFTVAHSIALGATHAPPSAPAHSVDARAARRAVETNEAKYWSSRTYLLWEPGLPLPAGDIDGAFAWGALGGTLGVRWDRYTQRDSRAYFTAGAWGAVASALLPREASPECRQTDVRPYVALVAGFRGSELYFSPKFGVFDLPHLCLFDLNFGANDGSSGF